MFEYMKIKVITTTIIIGVCICVAVLVYIYRNDQSVATANLPVMLVANPTPTQPEISPIQQSDGSLLYQNNTYGFSVTYPNTLKVVEYAEAKESRTIAFESNSKDVDEMGFEIYVTPYTQNQISEKQFKLDESSGVLIDQKEVLIDDVRGVIFYGNNSVMGDTREVWFIRNGFLYEVVTYKPLDEWLGRIMKTWKFTSGV